MNLCMFTGNISWKGDLKQTQTTAVLKFSVAVNSTVKGQDTSFIGFTAFGKTAEFIDQWCKVGTKVAVQSHYKKSSYDGKDGKKHYSEDFLVDNLEKLSSKADDEKQGFTAPADGFMEIEDSNDDGIPFN